MNIYGDKTFRLLEKAMDAGNLRQRVIANNIANINTPGFKKSLVKFESILKEELSGGRIPLATGDERHFGVNSLVNVNPLVVKETATSMRADGNNVDIDDEMTKLAANTINYYTVTQELNNRFRILGTVINGR